MEMNYLARPVEFKASGEEEGVYEGHFSIFGNVDDGGDVVHPGAFTKTISERGKRVKVFYGHDWFKLIGPPPEVLMEDSVGLFAKGRLTLNSFWGKETWALMKDGALTEGSFGYESVKFDWDQDQIRHLREVKLYEISPVPLGMNGMTAVRAVKLALREAEAGLGVDGYLEALTAAAEGLKELKEGRVLSAGNKAKVEDAIGAMKAAMEALNDLLAAAEPEKGGQVGEGPSPLRNHSALLKRLRAVEVALTLTPGPSPYAGRRV